MPKHSFTPEQVVKICDYVHAGKDETDQHDRRLQMAEKHDVTPETIQSITAHITIRQNEAVRRVEEILQKRQLRLRRAQEGMAFVEKTGMPDAPSLKRKLNARAKKVEASYAAQELLMDGDFRTAIDAFAAAGDSENLEEIAAVYAPSRPDLAALALRAAGSVDGVLELAALQLRAGNRRLARKVLEGPNADA